MEGIIVQTERIYRGVPVVVTAALVILAALFLVVYLLRLIRYCKKNKGQAAKAIAVYVAAVIICILGSCCLVSQSMTIHNYLVITIDDSVSFNEFNKRYEVMSKDGNLYTVRELPIEENEAGDNE